VAVLAGGKNEERMWRKGGMVTEIGVGGRSKKGGQKIYVDVEKNCFAARVG
jgi:hypothetical protein